MSPQIIKILANLSDAGRLRFILDSGAFTAWKLGRPINLDDYCRMIDSLPFKPWRYFNLDVIGNPEATHRNYQTMLKRGFNPVPIFTRGESPDVLDDYYKTSDLVGIGGLVGTYKNRGYVKWLMKAINNRPVHLLGFTDLQFLKHYRPYSCDSSTLEVGKRYGEFSVFDAEMARWVKITKADFIKRPPPELYDLIASYGVRPEELAMTKSWRGGINPAVTVCYKSHIRASTNYAAKLGVMYFMALANLCSVENLSRIYLDEIIT
jgi:hypothetical protein